MTGEKRVASRGVPSSESIYFPSYKKVRSFQDDSENPTRNLWTLEEVVNFVFPKEYQEVYHKIAFEFMIVVTKKLNLDGKDMALFLRNNSFSKATFYNRVLPKLRRAGLIKVERRTIVALDKRRKFRPMTISLSKTFGNYLMKIADSWLAIIDDSRSKKKVDTGEIK